MALLLDMGISHVRRKVFRFEKMWLEHSSFDSLVKQWWGEAPEVDELVVSFAGKLRFLKKKMKG